MIFTRHIAKLVSCIVLALGVTLAGPSALAHHSFAMFDFDKSLTVTGTVTEFQWTNPHIWIEMEAPGKDDAPVLWKFEGTSVSVLARAGWSNKSIALGDTITLDVHPLRDGGYGGSIVSGVLADGSEFLMPGTGGGVQIQGETLAVQKEAPADDTPDFSGLWVARPEESGMAPEDGGPGPVRRVARMAGDYTSPILKSWAAEVVKENHDRVVSGGETRSNGMRCLPYGIPNILTVPYPMQILQTPDLIVFLFEVDHRARMVYMNEDHPKDLEPSYYGHSTGKWEGNTLVVDTVGFVADSSVDSQATPHTEQMHVVERYSLIEDGKALEGRVLIEDPGAFTTPFTSITNYRPIENRLVEYVCPENNPNAVTAKSDS